jgi:CDP-6-deoxy-D-xylo-4-hexulose-3-dehydrase
MANLFRALEAKFNKVITKKKWVPGKDLVHYSGQYFTADEYIAAMVSILDDYIVLHKEGARFERNFPNKLGKGYGILTNSGSSANLLMMEFLKSLNGLALPKGSKILTPVAGFPTTINPIIQTGFTPVFVDIELDTLNLDLDKVEEALKTDPNIKAIFFAHVLGNPPDMDRLIDLAYKYDVLIIEDCCDALGSIYKGRVLGSFGRLASCSFYPAHHITMGEGGFVAAKLESDAKVLRSLRDWGRDCYCQGKANAGENGVCRRRFGDWLPDLPDEKFDHKYVYSEIGYNLKPIEVQAAIGNIQLGKLDEIIQIRKRNYNLLLKIFKQYEDKFIIHRATEHSDPAWFAFPLTVKKDAGFSRYDFVKFLEENKIQTRQFFGGNILLQPAYRHKYGGFGAKEQFPNATYATINTFFLGTSPVITEEQIEYISKIVNRFFEK